MIQWIPIGKKVWSGLFKKDIVSVRLNLLTSLNMTIGYYLVFHGDGTDFITFTFTVKIAYNQRI